jgi:hypothetical protein
VSLAARAGKHMSERFSWAPKYSNELTTDHGTHRYVPPGVDARTWLGFEERIRERRFRALLESIDVATKIGDRAAALAAVEEARQLRPGSQGLSSAEARAVALPVDAAAVAAPGYVWSRLFSAVALLLVGVSMLLGIDWLQMSSAPPQPSPSVVSLPPPPSVSLPPLGALNIPAIEVVVAEGVISTTRPAPPPKARRAAAVSEPVVAAAVPSSTPASTRQIGWGKVFKPTARFLTNTLPRFLGVKVLPDSGEPVDGERSST